MQQQQLKMLFVSEIARHQREEAKEADGDPHSEVVARPTLTQITFHSLSLNYQCIRNMTVPSSSPQHISNIVEKERKVRETLVIVSLLSS